MIRRIAKNLLGAKQQYETVGQYYKRVSHVERKIKEYIYTAILYAILAIAMGWGLLTWTNEPTGHYEPDYVDENGILHDTDGDGDYYHWLEE